jgi:hypothetical protein
VKLTFSNRIALPTSAANLATATTKFLPNKNKNAAAKSHGVLSFKNNIKN